MMYVELSRQDRAGARFRVWCASANRYVLQDAREAEVREFFKSIAISRALDAVNSMVQEALSCGAASPRSAQPVH